MCGVPGEGNIIEWSGEFLEIREKMRLQQSESGYFYFNVGGGGFNRPRRIWVNKRLVRWEERKNWRGEKERVPYVILRGVTFVKTEKGNFVLRPGHDRLFKLFAECGYRGGSTIEVEGAEWCVQANYYHSPRGSLGVSHTGLIRALADRVIIRATRSGRLYGKASKEVVIIDLSANKVIPLEDLDLDETELLE